MWGLYAGHRNHRATVRQQYFRCANDHRFSNAGNTQSLHWSVVGSLRPQTGHRSIVDRIFYNLLNANDYRLGFDGSCIKSMVVHYSVFSD